MQVCKLILQKTRNKIQRTNEMAIACLVYLVSFQQIENLRGKLDLRVRTLVGADQKRKGRRKKKGKERTEGRRKGRKEGGILRGQIYFQIGCDATPTYRVGMCLLLPRNSKCGKSSILYVKFSLCTSLSGAYSAQFRHIPHQIFLFMFCIYIE